MKIRSANVIFLILSILFIWSCGKNTDVSPASTISDISPKSGQPGTTVYDYGYQGLEPH